MFKVITQKKTSLIESSQDKAIRFAFCKEEGDTLTMCHQFVKCRDFLSDVWYHVKSGKDVSYYGFKYDSTFPRPDVDAVKLLIYIGNLEDYEAFQQNQELLINTIAYIGWGTPTITPVSFDEGEKTYFYLKAPIQWCATSYSLSLLTFLCRLACYKNTEGDLLSTTNTRFTVDKGYLQSKHLKYGYTLRDAIKVWMNSPLLIDFGTTWEVETIHDYGGVLNTFMSQDQKLNTKQLQEHIHNEMSKL